MAITEPRPCTRCGERPEVITRKGKRRSWCNACFNTFNKKLAAENPERYFRMRRSAHLRRKYGLTLDDYERLLRQQSGGCAICRVSSWDGRHLAVDHDANTGKVRGLLCGPCNRAIGQLNHDPERVRRAADYLDAGVAEVAA